MACNVRPVGVTIGVPGSYSWYSASYNHGRQVCLDATELLALEGCMNSRCGWISKTLWSDTSSPVSPMILHSPAVPLNSSWSSTGLLRAEDANLRRTHTRLNNSTPICHRETCYDDARLLGQRQCNAISKPELCWHSRGMLDCCYVVHKF